MRYAIGDKFFNSAKVTTMSAEIKTKLSQYIAKEILKNPKRVIKDDEAIISSGMIDSFHLVDLSLFVENEFGVRIDDSELNKETFDTIDQLAALIESRK